MPPVLGESLSHVPGLCICLYSQSQSDCYTLPPGIFVFLIGFAQTKSAMTETGSKVSSKHMHPAAMELSVNSMNISSQDISFLELFLNYVGVF